MHLIFVPASYGGDKIITEGSFNTLKNIAEIKVIVYLVFFLISKFLLFNNVLYVGKSQL
jgi:hypothetical protein